MKEDNLHLIHLPQIRRIMLPRFIKKHQFLYNHNDTFGLYTKLRLETEGHFCLYIIKKTGKVPYLYIYIYI